MLSMTNSTESAGVLISASSGVSVDNVNIYGSSYLSTSEYPLLLPRYRQLGLIAVAPLGNTSGGTLVIGQTEHLSPLRFSNVKLEAYDNATYCFQVLSDSVLNYFERDINVSVTVTDGTVVGGAVGALIGAQSKTSAVFRNVDFSLSYYGAYLNNGSSGVDFMDCTFTKHCIGIYMGGDASDAYANGVFSGNSVALEMYGDYYSVGNADILSETGDECPEAPYIYDSDQYDWVFKRRSLRDDEEEPTERDVPIVEF